MLKEDTTTTFSGLRKYQAREVAEFAFGDEAVIKVDMNFKDRTFEVIIWSEKVDSSINKDNAKKRLEKKYKQCKVIFMTYDIKK